MKLEFLDDGSPDCPLIRLFDFNLVEAGRLGEVFLTMAHGGESIPIHRLSWIEPIAGCKLTLRVAKLDEGVVRCSGLDFECRLTPGTWEQVAGLAEPFGETTGPSRFQWLTNEGKVALLLSCDGSW